MTNSKNLSFSLWHFLPFITILFFGSCVSMSTMQTGRTVGQGNYELNIGGSAVKLETIIDTDSTELNGGLLEGDFRYGVNDRLDVGLKVSLLGTSGLYGKYQLVGDQESMFALSAGLNAGYVTVTSGEGDDETSSTIVDVAVPVYASVHPTKWLSIYATPRYNLRFGSGTSNWYGGTGGIRLGNKFAVFAEYSYVDSDDAIEPLNQITGGIGFRF